MTYLSQKIRHAPEPDVLGDEARLRALNELALEYASTLSYLRRNEPGSTVAVDYYARVLGETQAEIKALEARMDAPLQQAAE